MGSLGGPEMLILAVVIFFVFGASWLPKMARKAGQNKVHLERAKSELDAAKTAATAPIKGVTDTIAKVDKTLNTKPTDLVKKMAQPAKSEASAEATPVAEDQASAATPVAESAVSAEATPVDDDDAT